MSGDGGSGPAAWDQEADEHEKGLPRIGPYPIAGLIQRARRMADLSQRELARRCGLSPSTVGRVESGTIRPTLDAFQRMLACAGLFLVVVDGEGRVVQPMRAVDDVRDGAGRRYPAHLDTILDPKSGEWWADKYGLARPPETFYRDRRQRDYRRALSQWEVRAATYRHVGPPDDPAAVERWLAEREQPREPVDRGFAADEVDVDEWDEPGGQVRRRADR